MSINNVIDEASNASSFTRQSFDSEAPTDPDATSFYDLTPAPPRNIPLERARRLHRRLICAARQDIAGLREALASGWDVGPELAYEEQRLVTLLATDLC